MNDSFNLPEGSESVGKPSLARSESIPNLTNEELDRLRSSELLLQVISENVADLIAVVDQQGHRIWNNAAYAERLGYSPSELRGSDSMVEIHPDDVALVKSIFAESMAGGQGRRIEYRMRHRDNSWVHLESEGRIAQNWNGHERCLVIVARDITERKWREREERQRNERLLAQANALAEFSSSAELQSGDLASCFDSVTENAAKFLPCGRASVWLFDREGHTLECHSLYTFDKSSDFPPPITLQQHPTFVGAVSIFRFIAAPLVRRDARLMALSDYFQSCKTEAALIMPLRRGNRTLGMLLCEQGNGARTWSLEDRSFCAALAEGLVLAFSTRERLDTHEALRVSQEHLAAELAEAAGYVRSLLPPRLNGVIETEWRFIPSTALGGDAFGHHWIDENRLAIYLVDVVGHGVGAALVSVAVLNSLRSQSLPEVDFCEPAEVLRALNRMFQMEEQNEMYFTIWYGVFDRQKREISYSVGGHPPALLFTGPSADSAQLMELRTPGLMIGAMPDVEYKSASCSLGTFARLYVFSDGIYEILKPDGTTGRLADFIEVLKPRVDLDLDSVLSRIRELQTTENFEDDVSLLSLRFNTDDAGK